VQIVHRQKNSRSTVLVTDCTN